MSTRIHSFNQSCLRTCTLLLRHHCCFLAADRHAAVHCKQMLGYNIHSEAADRCNICIYTCTFYSNINFLILDLHVLPTTIVLTPKCHYSAFPLQSECGAYVTIATILALNEVPFYSKALYSKL